MLAAGHVPPAGKVFFRAAYLVAWRDADFLAGGNACTGRELFALFPSIFWKDDEFVSGRRCAFHLPGGCFLLDLSYLRTGERRTSGGR